VLRQQCYKPVLTFKPSTKYWNKDKLGTQH
jgi:hypothetical protein